MLHTLKATRGMVSAPHHLAAQSGLAVLREGGNAIEATLAAAATLAVVHPHLSGLGGDGFWLIAEPGKVPISIDGSGAAAAAALPALYRGHGLGAIPAHGPLAALTVAGTVSGWQAAQEMASRWDGRLPLARLFEDAIHYARNGSPVSDHQACAAEALWPALAGHGALVEGFGVLGEPPQAGREQKQPALADTFGRLATRWARPSAPNCSARAVRWARPIWPGIARCGAGRCR
ncbi:MAG: gamma-glutamyltransferase [Rhodospirillales bacterium]|nr:gamma-glutamyltransferase [Rhodospirillales bacterium]